MRRIFFMTLLLATGLVLADGVPEAKKRAPGAPEAPAAPAAPAEPSKQPEQEKKAQSKESGNLGMSILGNQEAPKALVIVPWKSSELGGALGISPILDDSRLPVDREVFLRALSYYEIRSEKKK
jgi:hypothetical protein